ncbi:hypothetical protein QAD02_005584 [Eretmocerus hayati]|uniref:Uncharacterized protein n=1 Tax=Eretmocerus hayati TaxID=131215 RepID=A0ACC2NVS6_9HYME|nr:hypothetical protein QAD02_005584 [Eretmocerus hayati]
MHVIHSLHFCLPGYYGSHKLSLNSSSSDSAHAGKILSTPDKSKQAIYSSVTRSALANLKAIKESPKDDRKRNICFEDLLSNLVLHKAELSATEALEIIKTLSWLNMPESLTVYTMLVHHILDHTEDLSLEEVIELFIEIKRTSNCKLPENLIEHVRNVIPRHLKEEMAKNHGQHSTNHLLHATHMVYKLLNKPQYQETAGSLIEELIPYVDKIPVKDALSVLKTLNTLDPALPKWKELYLKAQNNILKQLHSLDKEQFQQLVGESRFWLKISKNSRLNACLSNDLVEAMIQRIILNDVDVRVVLAFARAIRSGHKARNLLDYCSVAIFKKDEHEEDAAQCGTQEFAQLIYILSYARYLPVGWEDLQDYISESSKFLNLEQDKLIYLVENLINLNWYPIHLLGKIFDGSFKCSNSMDSEWTHLSWAFLRIYRKIKSDPSYNGPWPTDSQIKSLDTFMAKTSIPRTWNEDLFRKYVVDEFKNTWFETDVRTRLFHDIDCVVALHEDGTPAPMVENVSSARNQQGVVWLEDLKVPTNCHMILILGMPGKAFLRYTNELAGGFYTSVQSLQDAYKLPVAVINTETCMESPAGLRRTILMNEIQSKLKSFSGTTESPHVEKYTQNQFLASQFGLDKVDILSAQKVKADVQVGIPLIRALLDLDKKYLQYPANDAKKVSEFQKFCSVLAPQIHLLPGDDAIRIAKILQRAEIAECSSMSSALICHIAQCLDDVPIEGYRNLFYLIKSKERHKFVKECVTNVMAQKINEKLSVTGNEFSIQYLAVGLEIVINFLDHRKYYELVRIFMRKIYHHPVTIPIDKAASMLMSLKEFKYTPPVWKSSVRRLQNEVANQAASINQDRIKRLMFENKNQTHIPSWLNYFYGQDFINVLIQSVISNNLGFRSSFHMLTNLRPLKYKSPELLEYSAASAVDELVHQKKSSMTIPRFLPPLIHSLSMARHHTESLQVLYEYCFKFLENWDHKQKELINTAVNLLALKFYPIEMLEVIFHSGFKRFEYDLEKIRLCLMIYQKLKSDPSYNGPMPPDSLILELESLSQIRNRPLTGRFNELVKIRDEIGNRRNIRANVKTRLFHNIGE